jgi:anti-anti-sigma factor
MMPTSPRARVYGGRGMEGHGDRAAARAEARRLREESQALRAEAEQAIRRSQQLCIHSDRITEHSYLLKVAGELDIVSAGELQERVAALRGESADIALELTELEFIDSTGLRLLLELTRSDDGVAPVRILSSSPAVTRLAELTGTTSRLGL